MNHLGPTIFAFCLLGLSEFASKSQAGLGCFCGGGGGTTDEQPRSSAANRNWRERPDVPERLASLSELNSHLTAVDSRAHSMASRIKVASVAAAVARFMSNDLRREVTPEGFKSRTRELVVEPCAALETELGSWYDQVTNSGMHNPDEWYFTARICRIIGGTGDILERAYAAFQRLS